MKKHSSPIKSEIEAAIRFCLKKASAEKCEAIYQALKGWDRVAGQTVAGTKQSGTAIVKKMVDAGEWTGAVNDIVHIHTYATTKKPRNSFTMDIGTVCAHLRGKYPTCWAAVNWDEQTVTPYHGVPAK